MSLTHTFAVFVRGNVVCHNDLVCTGVQMCTPKIFEFASLFAQLTVCAMVIIHGVESYRIPTSVFRWLAIESAKSSSLSPKFYK